MTYIATITSQGQISIPAKLRKELGFEKNSKVILQAQGKNILIEPLKNISELKGIFHTSKKISFQTIRNNFEKYLVNEAVQK